MKLKTVLLVSGLPGSGKTTWIKSRVEKDGGVWCSRDNVRFAMLNDSEAYFSHENDVFNEWIAQIRAALADPQVENIYVDATHLNDRSRNKTLNKLPKDNIDKIINVVFATPVEVCLERNAQRTGRARVPDEVILNMAKSFKAPTKYDTLIINAEGEEDYGKSLGNI